MSALFLPLRAILEWASYSHEGDLSCSPVKNVGVVSIADMRDYVYWVWVTVFPSLFPRAVCTPFRRKRRSSNYAVSSAHKGRVLACSREDALGS